MPPALIEFLSIKLDAKSFGERAAFVKDLSALTPEQQERKVLQIYRAEHGGSRPPALSLSGTRAERLLRAYPSSAALDAIIRAHAGSTALFYATWFPEHSGPTPARRAAGNPKYAEERIVTASGKIWSQRRLWSWATQGGGTMRPNEEVRAAVQQALRALPPSDARPSLDRLLIVTCRREGGWQTHLYDRANLPKSIKAAFDCTENRGINGLPGP